MWAVGISAALDLIASDSEQASSRIVRATEID
jgi:hypothetical protein